MNVYNNPTMVCPARAGMIRDWFSEFAVMACLPRTRGDDPVLGSKLKYVPLFAPHARG